MFQKQEGARFLSHLDLQATLEYAFRRARLPMELSQGFNPRPRASIAAPLPVGYTGEREILEIVLRHPLPSDDVVRRLQAALPAGINLTSAEEMPQGAKPAAACLHTATYRVHLPTTIPDLETRAEALLARRTLEVEEDRDGKVRTRDIRPQTLSLEADSGNCLRMEVRLDPGGTARPEQIVALLGIDTDGIRIVRERITLGE